MNDKPSSNLPQIVFHLFAHAVAASVVVLLLVQVSAVYATFFEQTQAMLPPPTMLVMGTSQWMSKYWYFVVPLCGIADAAVVMTLGLSDRLRGMLSFWTICVLLLAILFLTFCHLAFSIAIHGLAN